ncbi:unnamed protein product [Coffea canephora]|uniref:DH200=94 genomic scaffold, scaffold_1680 n=1 Tax=Coffea canephora TaxID=49390 RepID=A0A068VIY1_COFCA|nr:unnamed protein product [Coffea canephora]
MIGVVTAFHCALSPLKCWSSSFFCLFGALRGSDTFSIYPIFSSLLPSIPFSIFSSLFFSIGLDTSSVCSLLLHRHTVSLSSISSFSAQHHKIPFFDQPWDSPSASLRFKFILAGSPLSHWEDF